MSRLTSLLLVTALVVLAGCGQQRRGARVDQGAAKTTSGGTSASPDSGELVSKWDRMMDQLQSRFPTLQQDQDRALDLLADARKLKKESDGLAGDAAKAKRKEAGAKYAEAGTIYDRIREKVDDLDEDLWDRKFSRFQARWDRAAKGLKRLNF